MVDRFEAGPATTVEGNTERRPAIVVLYDFGPT